MRKRKELFKFSLTAIFAAVAIVLELIITFVPGLNLEMPFSGRVFGISMLPIILLSFLCGIKYGLIGGGIYATTNILLSLNQVLGWGLTPQAVVGTIFLDYAIPFTLLGLAGIFKNGMKDKKEFVYGTLMVCGIRYISHVISGVVVFASFTPEGTNMWVHTFILYNLPYMASSTALCIIVGLLVINPISAYLKLDDQQLLGNQDEDSN